LKHNWRTPVAFVSFFHDEDWTLRGSENVAVFHKFSWLLINSRSTGCPIDSRIYTEVVLSCITVCIYRRIGIICSPMMFSLQCNKALDFCSYLILSHHIFDDWMIDFFDLIKNYENQVCREKSLFFMLNCENTEF